jgi:hypothetical protein
MCSKLFSIISFHRLPAFSRTVDHQWESSVQISLFELHNIYLMAPQSRQMCQSQFLSTAKEECMIILCNYFKLTF